jgi:hypothetical protein
MKVEFTKDVEEERVNRATWDAFSSRSIVEVVHKAKELGWAEKKVQVRSEKTGKGIMYYIEPYEEGCGCMGMLRYGDFFDPPS